MANRTKKNVRLKDLTEIRLVGVYLVQKLTFPTATELRDAARDRLGATIHPSTLERAMKGAASAGFVAVHQKQTESGHTETAYRMKNLSWKNPPEFAHIGDLLPVLLKTDEAQTIKDWFDKQEGEGAKKKRRGNDIADYRMLRWTVISTDPYLGSQIPCEHTDNVRKEFPTNIERNKVEVEGIFQRDPLTGEFLIPQDVLQGWFASNALRYLNLPEGRAGYIAFSPIRITPKGDVEQLVLPVMSKQGPATPKKYECLPPGQVFEINMTAPTKGALTVEQYEFIVLKAGLRPKRGLSPARGRRYGRFLVIKFEDLGAVEPGCDLSPLEADIPRTLMDEHGDYYRDALTRLKGIPSKPTFDPGDFPGGEVEDDEVEEAA